jgi:hypothetical protein
MHSQIQETVAVFKAQRQKDLLIAGIRLFCDCKRMTEGTLVN